jgi:hypothetical protein
MADENPQEAQQSYAPDWFLQVLINFVNNPGNPDLEIGITVLSRGYLVSGYLVNGAKYFEGFASDFATIFAPGPLRASEAPSPVTEIYTRARKTRIQRIST